MAPFSVVKNIKMYPLSGGHPSEHVFVKYFDRGRDIGDTQAKSGNIELSMYMLGCKVALEQDLSIGAIFSGRKYSDVPFFWRAALRACSYQVF